MSRWSIRVAATATAVRTVTAVSAAAAGATGRLEPAGTPRARAAAWPMPTVVFVGEDEAVKAEQGSRGGSVYLYLEGRNITAASWTLGGLPAVAMHRGSDPVATPGNDDEPLIGGTVSWVGGTTHRRIVQDFEWRSHKRYVLRVWDRRAFAEYVSAWRCGGASFGFGPCQTDLERVSSHVS